MRNSLRSALFALGLAAVATPAYAGYVDVVYDLGATGLNVTAPLAAQIPPSGTVTGQATIRFNSATGAIDPGAATLLTLTLNVLPNVTVLGGAVVVTGDVNVMLMSPVAGNLTGGGQMTFGGGSGFFSITGFVHCFGLFCGLAGLPNSTPQNVTPTVNPAPIALAPMFVPGSVNDVSGSLPVAFGQIVGTAFLAGNEISRVFTPTAPEPTGIALAGLGILGLAAAARRRFRRD